MSSSSSPHQLLRRLFLGILQEPLQIPVTWNPGFPSGDLIPVSPPSQTQHPGTRGTSDQVVPLQGLGQHVES